MKKILKLIYDLLPFKKQVFGCLRWLNLPKSIYQHLHFKGIFEVGVWDRKHVKIMTFKMRHYGLMLENELFWRGIPAGWEKETMNLWIELCKKSQVIFDIGANTGIFSLVAKAVNSDARVYGFEPITKTFKKFKQNCLLNKFDIYCEELAVSDLDGSAFIYQKTEGDELGASMNEGLNENVIPQKINSITLASYINQNNINEIDLMKIDVETYETKVLEGMEAYLEMFRPTLIIEILTNKVAKKLENILKGKNYSYYYINNEESSITKVNNLQAHHHLNTNYLICTDNVF